MVLKTRFCYMQHELLRRSPSNSCGSPERAADFRRLRRRHTKQTISQAGSTAQPAGSHKQQMTACARGYRHTCQPLRSGISQRGGTAFYRGTAKIEQNIPFCLKCVVMCAPRGQGAQDNSQGQGAQAEADRKDKAKASKESGNVRDKASIPTDRIKDEVKHLFYLQGILKRVQAISA